jgi:hypothetical protein
MEEVKKKAIVVDEWVENGEVMIKYESGMIKNKTRNRIVKPSDKPYITKENARDVAHRRVELAAERLRENISSKTLGKDVITKPAEALGMAGGMLWEDIVLNPDAAPRDRLQTFIALSKHSGMLTDMRETGMQNSDGVNIALGPNLARDIISQLMARNDGEL